MATRLGGVSKVLLMVFVFVLGAGSTLFVIRLPDILPDSAATAPAFLDAPAVEVESPPEPMISLVRNDAVASNAAPESANWDVVVFPPIAASEEAAGSKADAVVETPDLFVPTGNSLSPTVPDMAPPDAMAGCDTPPPIPPIPPMPLPLLAVSPTSAAPAALAPTPVFVPATSTRAPVVVTGTSSARSVSGSER